MRISTTWLQGNELNTEQTGEISKAELALNLRRGIQEMMQKSPGETILGEILDVKGKDILLSLGKGQMIQAKLDAGIDATVGQKMSFGVKSSGTQGVVLTPLFENMKPDSSALRALSYAGIPENSENIKMVWTMMQEGMRIDPDSLNKMLQTINDYPMASTENIVQLSRLELPVNESNLMSFEQYKNATHQITNSMIELADTFSQTVSSLFQEGVFQEGIAPEAITVLKEALQFAVDEQMAASFEEGDAVDEAFSVQQEGLEENQSVPRNEIVEPSKLEPETLGTDGKSSTTLLENQETIRSTNVEINTFQKELFDLLKLLSKDELSAPEQKEVVHLLQSKNVNHILRDSMIEKWLLDPKEITEEKKIEEFYHRLDTQLQKLKVGLQNAGLETTPFAKSVQTLSGNIDFMNQLNHMFQYVQLPLKLQNQNANGDLYVYTNKKNLAKPGGEVSALLHLDLDHLGSVDVHVTMKESRVATKFYLKDEEALDLVESHIDLLNDRLMKKGYSMNTSFSLKEESENTVMDEILDRDRNISILSSNSFDVRA